MSCLPCQQAAMGAALQKSAIDWWCWDHPGFKDCHARQWEAARDLCTSTNAAGYTSMETCITKETDSFARRNCACPTTAPKAGGGGAPSLGTVLLGVGLVALCGVAAYKYFQNRD